MNKLFWFFLLISSAAFGQSYSRQDFYFQSAQRKAIPGASVYIMTQPANISSLTPLATIYGSSTGSGTANCGSSAGTITNPVTTDGFGHACAYAAPGLYTVCYISSVTGTACYPDQNFYLGGVTEVTPSTQYQIPCYSASGITVQGGCGVNTDVSGTLFATGAVVGDPFSDVRYWGNPLTCAPTGTSGKPTSDNAALLAAIAGGGNRIVLPRNGNCTITGSLAMPSTTEAVVLDLNGGTLNFTGTGGGTCSTSTNGLFQIGNLGAPFTITNGNITAPNLTSCLFNFSNASFAHTLWLDHLNIGGPGGSGTTSQMLYFPFSGNVYLNYILSAGFAQYGYCITQCNNVVVSNSAFQPNTVGSSGYDFQVDGAESVSFTDDTFEGTPAITATGASCEQINIRGGWFGDRSDFTSTPWLNLGCAASHISGVWMSGGGEGIQNYAGMMSISDSYIFGTAVIAIDGSGGTTRVTNNAISYTGTGVKIGVDSQVTNNVFASGDSTAAIRISGDKNFLTGNGFGSVTGTLITCGSGLFFNLINQEPSDIDPSCNPFLFSTAPQHSRVNVCTTAASVGATCAVSVPWLTPFPDLSYTANCTVNQANAFVALLFSAKTTGSVTVSLYNLTATALSSGSLDCIAQHD